MLRQKILEEFHKIGVIYKESVKLRSGIISSFYCDIKKAYGYPEILIALADIIGEKLKKKENCISVMGYGGVPLGAVIASRFSRKFILVRENKKKHGKGGYIDGYIPTKKDTIVIIDDVLTTGGSIREILSVLNKTDAKISRAIVVVKRGETNLSIPYDFIFPIEEIVKNIKPRLVK